MIALDNKKILLIRNDNVGDLICTTPTIEALRKKYSDAQIDIVVNSYNYDALHNNPFVNTVYCYTKPKHKKKFSQKLKAGFGKLKILYEIRKEKYDVVVVFRSGYSKSAELFSNVSVAPVRVGVKDPKGKDNFTKHIKVERGKHEVEFCFDCLAPFGVVHGGEKTRYYIDDALRNKYHHYSEYILFHISSRIKENRYAKEHFKAVFDRLSEHKLLISAEPDDIESAKWLDKHTDATYVPTTSLQDLGGIIANVKLFVTLDGGAMHLGPAVGTKTISISGKTDMDKWYPWGYKALVIQDDSKIADNIDPQRVVEMIERSL